MTFQFNLYQLCGFLLLTQSLLVLPPPSPKIESLVPVNALLVLVGSQLILRLVWDWLPYPNSSAQRASYFVAVGLVFATLAYGGSAPLLDRLLFAAIAVLGLWLIYGEPLYRQFDDIRLTAYQVTAAAFLSAVIWHQLQLVAISAGVSGPFVELFASALGIVLPAMLVALLPHLLFPKAQNLPLLRAGAVAALAFIFFQLERSFIDSEPNVTFVLLAEWYSLAFLLAAWFLFVPVSTDSVVVAEDDQTHRPLKRPGATYVTG